MQEKKISQNLDGKSESTESRNDLENFFIHESRQSILKAQQEKLKKWYQDECAKELDELIAQGFTSMEIDRVLNQLEGSGLFAIALAGNILRTRREMEARNN